MKTLTNAIRMLAVAVENDDNDREFYKETAEELMRLRSEVLAYDAKLDQDEIAPTGDDYNELLSIITS